MRKEVLLLLFIVAFAAIAYMVVISGESKLATPMKKSTPTQTAAPKDVKNNKQFSRAPEMEINPAKTYIAKVSTSMGSFTVTLDAAGTPKTVNNFVFLARKDFYDNTIFHRIIEDFMIQGGDPEGTGTGGPGYLFEDEITAQQAFDGPGVLAMANRGPDTNGSQFFITHAETPWLTGKHTIFGKVTEGMDVVNKIATVQVGPQDKPITDIVIKDIQIIEQ